MSFSKVEIANMAISHLRIGKEIANLETERSVEAAAVNRFFAIAREKVLRDFRWPFTTKFAALALVEEDPTDEWDFSYRYPSDCLLIRRVLSGSRNDSRQSLVSYIIGQDAQGILVYTDMEDAQIEYTKNESDTTRWPSDFVLAFSYYLAWLIAPRLTSGDQFGLGRQAGQAYSIEIGNARAAALNEQQPDQELSSELERSREDLDISSRGEDWTAHQSGSDIVT
ncbi:MAG TPA: hypothetical protein VJN63_09825 [Thermoplasmata archaeon]|nr:hypothetical protein [Thermoplasmata archaeon]